MRSGAFKAGSLSAFVLVIASGLLCAARAQDDLPFSSSGYGVAPLGISDSYMWARHSIGDGLGYRASYSNLGAFVPITRSSDLGSMTFLEPRVLVTNYGEFGANMGLGYRGFLPDVNKVLGLSFWYDRDNGHFFQYDQLAATAELLGDNWDLRTNGYFPLGSRNRLISESVVGPASPTFVGRNILLGTLDSQREVALGGVDAEIGRNIAAIPGLRLFGGYYFYQGDEVGAAHGARFRVSYQMSDAVGAGFSLTDDRVFGTNAVFNITLQWPLRNVPSSTAYYAEDRMNILTERHDRVVATQSRTRNQMFAQNRDTGERIDVVHVDDDAAAGGNGSVNSPVNTLSAAEDAARNGSIIFVRSGTYTDSIALTNGQRLLGDGLGTHMVSSRQGNFLLPGQTVGPLPTISPTNSSFAVLLGPGSFGTEVAGFNILNTSASPVAGIAGISNDSFYIHDNLISAPNGYGVLMVNATGNGEWQNGTALDHRMGVFDNTVVLSQFGGITIGHATITQSDLTSLGIDPSIASQIPTAPSGNLEVDIQGNLVANNGTSTASSQLDANFGGVKSRFGIGVASSTNTTITADISDNTVSGNGAVGAMNDATDATGGIAVAAINGSNVNATVSNNTLNGNVGIGIGAVVQDTGSQVSLTATGNQITNQGAAWIVNPTTTGDPTFEAAIGIAGLAENGTIIMQLNDNELVGGASGVTSPGIFLATTQASTLQATLAGNLIHDWTDDGITLMMFDASQATMTFNAGNRIHDNGGHGLDIDANDGSQATVNILADNEFYNNGQTGISVGASDTAQVSLLIDGVTVYANEFNNIAIRAFDDAALTATIRNSEIRDGVNAFASGLLAQAFSSAPMRINLTSNFISGNPSDGVRFENSAGTLFANVVDNRFGMQAAGSSNGNRDFFAENQNAFGDTRINFTGNRGDNAQGFDFNNSSGGNFDLYEDDNVPAPTTTGVNVVGSPIVFP